MYARVCYHQLILILLPRFLSSAGGEFGFEHSRI